MGPSAFLWAETGTERTREECFQILHFSTVRGRRPNSDLVWESLGFKPKLLSSGLNIWPFFLFIEDGDTWKWFVAVGYQALVCKWKMKDVSLLLAVTYLHFHSFLVCPPGEGKNETSVGIHLCGFLGWQVWLLGTAHMVLDEDGPQGIGFDLQGLCMGPHVRG